MGRLKAFGKALMEGTYPKVLGKVDRATRHAVLIKTGVMCGSITPEDMRRQARLNRRRQEKGK